MADPARDFLQDDSGDLAVVDGDFARVGGADAPPQGIRIRVRSILGEIFLDVLQGIDWLNSILVKNPDPVVARELIREAIADTPDVTNVVGSDLDVTPEREATVSYQVDTVYSTNPVTGQVGA